VVLDDRAIMMAQFRLENVSYLYKTIENPNLQMKLSAPIDDFRNRQP